MTEELLREDFIKYLKEDGCEVLAKEVQLFPASNLHDLIYLDKERKFVCIEFKLTDWKKVIAQAIRVLNGTPLVYVAMPLPATIQKRNTIQEECKELGLGLFWFNKNGKWDRKYSPNEKVQFKDEEWIHYYNQNIEKSLYNHYHFTFIAPYLGRAAEISRTVVYKTKNVIW